MLVIVVGEHDDAEAYDLATKRLLALPELW